LCYKLNLKYKKRVGIIVINYMQIKFVSDTLVFQG